MSAIFILSEVLSYKRWIILCYLKWKGKNWDKVIEQLILANSWSNTDWLFSLKLCSDWLSEPLTDEFQKWRQTQRQSESDRLLNYLLLQLKRLKLYNWFKFYRNSFLAKKNLEINTILIFINVFFSSTNDFIIGPDSWTLFPCAPHAPATVVSTDIPLFWLIIDLPRVSS